MAVAASPPVRDASIAVTARALQLRIGSHLAVDGADLAIPAGKRTVIIGPNGSGKSTLLRAMSGLQDVTAGSIKVLGGSPRSRRARIAHVLQHAAVNEAVPITVREVVAMGTYPRRGLFGRARSDDLDVAGALERLAIADLARRHLGELSVGQRRRVMVAQALVQQADLLLLDEPTAGLDLPSADRIEQIIAQEVARGCTVVVTTHDLQAAMDGDYVVLLATRVVAAGPPANALTQDHLASAYGGHLHELPGGGLLLDDPAPH